MMRKIERMLRAPSKVRVIIFIESTLNHLLRMNNSNECDEFLIITFYYIIKYVFSFRKIKYNRVQHFDSVGCLGLSELPLYLPMGWQRY
jgi:hypothetical protein